MNKINILDEIRKNENLLSLPQVVMEVLREVGKEDYSADGLARIILKDPSLTSNILRLANSSFYQRLTEIKTVNQAVSILGMTTVKCLALSSSLMKPETIAAHSGVDPKAFFTSTLSIATASEQLAKKVGYKSIEEAFIAGLLLDIGILFLLHHHPVEYNAIIRKDVRARTLVEAEQEVFGADHAEVGYHLAITWNLPEYISMAIKNHHDLRERSTYNELAHIVRLAVLLTSEDYSGFNTHIEDRLKAIHKISQELSLSKGEVDHVTFSLLPRTVETARYLNLNIGNIEEILIRANQEICKSYLTIENLFKERQELSQRLLQEEKLRGSEESKRIALATLSHYLNNAVMAIYGRSQLMRMYHNNDQSDKLLKRLDGDLNVVDKSVKRIIAVLEEMKEISPIDTVRFDKMSEALNIDARISQRLSQMQQSEKTEPVTAG